MTEDYERFMALLRSRRSCRAFTQAPLAEAQLEALREAFLLAPRAGGRRDLRCAFISDREQIHGLAEFGAAAFAAWCDSLPSPFIREEMGRYGENFFWFAQAPTLAVISAREEPAWLREAAEAKAPLIWGGELSAAMGAMALLLAAEALGLKACCLTGPLTVWRELETRLTLPGREHLALLIALGMSKDNG